MAERGEPSERDLAALRETADDLAYRLVSQGVKPYKAVLEEQARIDEPRFGEAAQDRFKQLTSELDLLVSLLERLKMREPFTPVVQDKKRLMLRSGPSETYTVKLAPASERIGRGMRQGQHQLSMHLNVKSTSESALDMIYAIGLSARPPQDVLEKYFRQSEEQLITFNTNFAFRSEQSWGGVQVYPQAGFSFRWNRGRDSRAAVEGVQYVGDEPHYSPLRAAIGLADFLFLQKAIILHSGTRPPQERDYRF